jgi:RimJ/RimL family protein N-acetyltransferase
MYSYAHERIVGSTRFYELECWRLFSENSHRVAFCIDARNERSRLAVERLGAKLDGVRRAERIGADGTVRDSAFYAILATEWPAIKAGLIHCLAP